MAASSPAGPTDADTVQRLQALRAERARYVAFAFCAFDVLVELNADLKVQFAAGPAHLFFGVPPEQLAGRSLGQLLAPASAGLVDEIKSALGSFARIAQRPTALAAKDGPRSVLLSGYALPNRPGVFHIGLVANTAPAVAAPKAAAGDRDAATGLLSADALAKMAGVASEGAPIKMALLDVDGIQEIDNRRTASGAASIMPKLGALLASQSVNGESAARLAAERFGVLIPADRNEDDLAKMLLELTRAADPKGVGAKVSGNVVALEAGGLDQADVTRAVLYAVNQFATIADVHDFKGKSVQDTLNDMVKDAIQRVSELRDVFASNKLQLVFQPIVELTSQQVRHQEALSRLPDGKSPFRMVTFAEEAGFVAEFDLGVAERVLKMLSDDPKSVNIGVNVSGRSLQSQVFLSQFDALLARYASVRRRMMIEITESSRIVNMELVENAITSLKKQGHKILIDDFGSGAAAFHYLRAFQVDTVKIDGSYVQGMSVSERDRAFVRAITSLCKDLGLGTVAEMVEDETQASMLKKIGVDYAQGYLFGRPQPRLSRAAATSEAAPATARRSGTTTRWQ